MPISASIGKWGATGCRGHRHLRFVIAGSHATEPPELQHGWRSEPVTNDYPRFSEGLPHAPPRELIASSSSTRGKQPGGSRFVGADSLIAAPPRIINERGRPSAAHGQFSGAVPWPDSLDWRSAPGLARRRIAARPARRPGPHRRNGAAQRVPRPSLMGGESDGGRGDLPRAPQWNWSVRFS